MKKIIVALCLIAVVAAGVIHFLPVSVDSAACSGGFETAVFDKYSEKLVSDYYDGEADIQANPVKGTQECSWDGRSICLEFDVEISRENSDVSKERLRFDGKRVWTEVYLWNDGTTVE